LDKAKYRFYSSIYVNINTQIKGRKISFMVNLEFFALTRVAKMLIDIIDIKLKNLLKHNIIKE